MSLKSVIDLFAGTVGADINALRAADTALTASRGDMTQLGTTHKTTLVGALNELKTAVDDTITEAEVSTLIGNAIDGLINGAPGTYDTLKEIADYIAADQTAATAIMESLAKRVRVDAAQNFTEGEKTQGRANIGAASDAELTALETGVGDYANADPRGVYIAARDAA